MADASIAPRWYHGKPTRVVTVIEFVSPTNKSHGDGRALYLKKRTECFAGGVNYVEIDLTRSGNRYAGFLPFNVPPELQQTYFAWTRRAPRPRRYELYPLSLRERLRPVGVPLREADPDVTLDLQPLIDLCYRNGGFDDIDYRADPPVPFTTEDARWADATLRAAGAR